MLAGLLLGSAWTLAFVLSNALPYWFNLPGMTPVPPARRLLVGIPMTAGYLLEYLKGAIQRGLAITSVLVLAQVLTRRRWLAGALGVLLLVALSLSGENYAVELPAGIVVAALTIFVAVRYGILALCLAFFANLVLAEAPLTLDLSRWYAGRGLFAVAVIAALAVYAFRLSLGGAGVRRSASTRSASSLAPERAVAVRPPADSPGSDDGRRPSATQGRPYDRRDLHHHCRKETSVRGANSLPTEGGVRAAGAKGRSEASGRGSCEPSPVRPPHRGRRQPRGAHGGVEAEDDREDERGDPGDRGGPSG